MLKTKLKALVGYFSIFEIVLWIASDIYGFVGWRKMLKRQNSNIGADECEND